MSDVPERVGDDYPPLTGDTLFIRHEAYERLASRLAEVEAERDEALNQLDSAQHSVEVLERRVAEFKARADRLAREVERLRPIVDELVTWQPLEVDDLIHRARAALTSEQGEA